MIEKIRISDKMIENQINNLFKNKNGFMINMRIH